MESVEGLERFSSTVSGSITAHRKKLAQEILLTSPTDPGLRRRTETCSRWVIPSDTLTRENKLLEVRLEDQDAYLPESEKPKSRTLIVQEWDGVVESVAEDSFFARLYERCDDFPVNSADIPLQEVEEQKDLVRPGARFTWFIGYRIQGSTRSRMSEITFRKLPTWTKSEIEAGAKLGEQLGHTAGWYAAPPST